MMLIIFSVFASFGGRISLETNGKYFPHFPKAFQVESQFDDTITLCTFNHVWHFYPDGSLLREFGRRGQGPNEYQFIDSVLWLGDGYFISDAGTLTVTELDAAGQFKEKHLLFLKRMTYCSGRIFGVDYDYESTPDAMFEAERKIIREVRFDIGSEWLGDTFFPVLESTTRARMLFSQNFVWLEGSEICVCNELEPVIHRFDSNYHFLGKKRMYLPGFSVFSGRFPNRDQITESEWMQWAWSVNRILKVFPKGENLWIQFLLPGPRESFEVHEYASWTRKMVCQIGPSGRPRGEPFEVPGILVGIRVNELVVLVESDRDEAPGFELQLVGID